MFKGKPIEKEILTDMTELIADYFSDKGKIIPTLNSNWEVTSGK